MKHKKTKKAFTLIELLVVIAIVGILAGLIMPVFGRARESARRALCANNLRQHGIAWYLYLDDHNDCFPKKSWLPSPEQADEETFGGKGGALGYVDPRFAAGNRPLNRYLDVYDDSSPSVEVFHCPDDICGATGGQDTCFNVDGTSYKMNERILIFGSFPSNSNRPLSTITSPRNKVCLEVCNPMMYPGHGRRSAELGNLVMVLFVDGHVGGPFSYDNYGADGTYDFQSFDPNTDDPVVWDPNGTEGTAD